MTKISNIIFGVLLFFVTGSLSAMDWSLNGAIERSSFDEKNNLTVGRYEGPLSGIRFGGALHFHDPLELSHRSEVFIDYFVNGSPEKKRFSSLNLSHALLWDGVGTAVPYFAIGLGLVQTSGTIPTSNYVDNHHDPYFDNNREPTYVESEGWQYHLGLGFLAPLTELTKLNFSFNRFQYYQWSISQKRAGNKTTFNSIPAGNTVDYYVVSAGVEYQL